MTKKKVAKPVAKKQQKKAKRPAKKPRPEQWWDDRHSLLRDAD